MRRRWWLIPAGVAVTVAAALVIAAVVWPDGGQDDVARDHTPTAPVLVGSISLDLPGAHSGAVVVATISLTADRPLRLDALVLAVRDGHGHSTDAAGRGLDFPQTGPVELGATERTLTVAHEFHRRGTYACFLRYRQGRTWHELPPYDRFTVR